MESKVEQRHRDAAADYWKDSAAPASFEQELRAGQYDDDPDSLPVAFARFEACLPGGWEADKSAALAIRSCCNAIMAAVGERTGPFCDAVAAAVEMQRSRANALMAETRNAPPASLETGK